MRVRCSVSGPGRGDHPACPRSAAVCPPPADQPQQLHKTAAAVIRLEPQLFNVLRFLRTQPPPLAGPVLLFDESDILLERKYSIVRIKSGCDSRPFCRRRPN